MSQAKSLSTKAIKGETVFNKNEKQKDVRSGNIAAAKGIYPQLPL